jgi:uncharacterized YigZ family protein
LISDSYQTIERAATGLYRDKGSKFIGCIFPADSEETCREIIARLRKEHHSARHWCYAYRLGPEKKLFRANDDGEPSGTAGRPILNQLIAADLTNVLLVVVRYFGGTLLGTSGLITAYKQAAVDAIKNAEIRICYITKRYKVRFETSFTNEVMRRLKEFDASVKSHTFEEQNEIIFDVRLSKTEELLSKFAASNLHTESIEP